MNAQYWQFRGIARSAAAVPWNRVPFEPAFARISHPDLRAWELRSSELRLVWIQSLHYTWWNVIHGAKLSPVENAWLRLEAVQPGRYRLEWWNTETGDVAAAEEQSTTGGTLSINLPPIRTDIALKIIRQPAS